MAPMTITDDDIVAVATKLDAMTDRFDEHERAALRAVFHLAGAAMFDAAVEVEGYGATGRPGPFTVTGGGPEGDGALDQAFRAGLHDGAPVVMPTAGRLTIELSR